MNGWVFAADTSTRCGLWMVIIVHTGGNWETIQTTNADSPFPNHSGQVTFGYSVLKSHDRREPCSDEYSATPYPSPLPPLVLPSSGNDSSAPISTFEGHSLDLLQASGLSESCGRLCLAQHGQRGTAHAMHLCRYIYSPNSAE